MFSSFKCRNCKCIGLLLFTSSFLLKKDKEKSEDNWDQPSDNDEVLNGLKAQTWRRLALSLSLWVLSFPAPEIALDTNTRFSFNFLSDLT